LRHPAGRHHQLLGLASRDRSQGQHAADLFRLRSAFHRWREPDDIGAGRTKARLKALLRRAPKNIYFVDHVIGNGQAFYDATCKHEAEGIVSKRIDAPYEPGDRGIWRKVKCINEDEFVVVGFTNPEGRRPYLGSLLLGYYTPAGDLIYAGRAGTGMNEAELKRLFMASSSRSKRTR
jgi:ATP-dependent DNA ligase